MSIDNAIRSGILGGPPRQGGPNKQDMLVFGTGAERDEATGRYFERGSGALPRQEQTAMFLRQQAVERDRPKEGDACPYSGRPYDCSIGALPKSAQTEQFFAELPDSVKAQWFAKAEALAAIEPQGRA
jgi:hypothetical protein